MYRPAAFREDRIEAMHAFVRANPFATIVAAGPQGLTASHVPVLLDAAGGPYGTLTGHFARGNENSGEALAIFLGPHAYISPSWYPSKLEHGRVVPTWNYTAVHAYGKLRPIHDRTRLLDIVTRLTERHEAEFEHPWSVADAPPDYIEQMLGGITGFEMTITRLEGKWKLSQNRPECDRRGVIVGLRGLAEAMEARNSG